MQHDDEILHTTHTASRRLDCSAETVRRLADHGDLPAVRTVSGQRLYRESDLDELARKRAQDLR